MTCCPKQAAWTLTTKNVFFPLLKKLNNILTLRAKGWIALFRVTEELAQYTNFREKEKEILDRVMDPKR